MLIFDLNIFNDNRGSFTEVWQTEEMQKLGLPELKPAQLGISRSRKGTIRGVHAEPWEKLIHVINGTAFIAISDIRPDSPTYGEVETFELTSNQALFLPKGLGNAFQAMTDVDYCYFVTGLWSADTAYTGGYVQIRFNDEDLAIDWPIQGNEQIVSIKDRQNPSLRETYPEKYQ
jgi:dTDP-4-dehydrorhamnose 3,5-epimerase